MRHFHDFKFSTTSSFLGEESEDFNLNIQDIGKFRKTDRDWNLMTANASIKFNAI